MATYYVANNGSDAASGLDSAHPFQTVAKIVSVAQAGDTMLLRRGDRWFESLGMPHSFVTADAYGAGPVVDGMGYCTNAPILDQGAAVTGWSAYAGGVTVQNVQDSFTGTTGTTLASHVPNIGTSWAVHPHFATTAQLAADGTVRPSVASTSPVYTAAPDNSSADYFVQMDAKFETIVAGEFVAVLARSTTSGNFNSYVGRLNSDGSIEIDRFVTNTGTALTSLGAGTITITAGVAHTIKLTVQGSTLTLFIDGVQKLQTTDSQVLTGSAGFRINVGAGVTDTTNAHGDNFSTGPLDSGTPTNTFQASLATQTLIVDHNQTYDFQGAGVNTLADQQWFWYQGVLYFRNDAGQPNNTEVIAGQRANGVSASGLSGLVVRNIAVEHSNDSAYFFNGCPNVLVDTCYGQRTSHWVNVLGENGFIHVVGASNSAVVQNCFGRFIGADGIYFNTGSAPQALYNTFHQLYEIVTNGIAVDAATPANGVVIRGNVIIFPNASVGSGNGTTSNSEKGGIINFSDNALIEQNFVAYAPLFGLTLPCNNPIVRDNVFYRCGGGPFYTVGLGVNGGGGGIRLTTNGGINISGHQIYRNLMLECPTGMWGFIDASHSVTGLLIVNNAIVNISVAPATQDGSTGGNLAAGNYQAYFQGGNGFGGTFANNLIYNFQGTGAALFFGTVAGTWTSDYNLWGPDGAGEFSWLGTPYASLAAYAAGSSKDAHSITAVPAFVQQGYTPPAAPPIRAIDALLAYRNNWRSPARHLGTPIPGMRQRVDPDAGLEYTYGWPLLDTNYDYASLS